MGRGEARISGALLLREDGPISSESETFNDLGTIAPSEAKQTDG